MVLFLLGHVSFLGIDDEEIATHTDTSNLGLIEVHMHLARRSRATATPSKIWIDVEGDEKIVHEKSKKHGFHVTSYAVAIPMQCKTRT